MGGLILADASIWIDHLRKGDPSLTALLSRRRVAGHVCVRGEISLGSLPNREIVLAMLDRLPQAPIARNEEVFAMVEARQWFARGVGYVDAQLLAATLLAPEVVLWTRDKRLAALAEECGRSFSPAAD